MHEYKKYSFSPLDFVNFSLLKKYLNFKIFKMNPKQEYQFRNKPSAFKSIHKKLFWTLAALWTQIEKYFYSRTQKRLDI